MRRARCLFLSDPQTRFAGSPRAISSTTSSGPSASAKAGRCSSPTTTTATSCARSALPERASCGTASDGIFCPISMSSMRFAGRVLGRCWRSITSAARSRWMRSAGCAVRGGSCSWRTAPWPCSARPEAAPSDRSETTRCSACTRRFRSPTAASSSRTGEPSKDSPVSDASAAASSRSRESPSIWRSSVRAAASRSLAEQWAS